MKTSLSEKWRSSSSYHFRSLVRKFEIIINRLNTKFYNSNYVNVILAELRLTKKRLVYVCYLSNETILIDLKNKSMQLKIHLKSLLCINNLNQCKNSFNLKQMHLGKWMSWWKMQFFQGKCLKDYHVFLKLFRGYLLISAKILAKNNQKYSYHYM